MYQPAVATGTLAVDSSGATSMLDQLVGMGFPLPQVQVALSLTDDLDHALTLLTDPSHARNLVEGAAPSADDMRSPAPASSSSSYIIPTTAPATGSSQPHSLPFPLADRRSVAWHHDPGSSPQVLIQGKADEFKEALDGIYIPAFKHLREARLQRHDSLLTITKLEDLATVLGVALRHSDSEILLSLFTSHLSCSPNLLYFTTLSSSGLLKSAAPIGCIASSQPHEALLQQYNDEVLLLLASAGITNQFPLMFAFDSTKFTFTNCDTHTAPPYLSSDGSRSHASLQGKGHVAIFKAVAAKLCFHPLLTFLHMYSPVAHHHVCTPL